ncbi:calcium-activated chloride channel-domain-containing protein [Lipomyces oligophaga]|uniref:calcium-activated chloride channel-domain-containing protein n=1 Tax=Lipomyces oligophaga TaxID=45792 RepID=UPI0034CE1CD0
MSESKEIPEASSSSPASTASKAPDHLEHDFVLVFDANSPAVLKKKPGQGSAAEALKLILTQLANAGFEFAVRPNRIGSVFIFVKASDVVVSITSYHSQVKDWLMSIRSTAPEPVENVVPASFSVAERLRLVYSRLMDPPAEHGLGITPGKGDWIYVTSVFASHDPEFDNAWVRRWSRKYILGEEELELMRDTFGEKVALYFAFLQDYFKWLLFPTIVGLVAYFFLPPFAPTFAAANCIWCCVFVEAWKHKEIDFAVKWGCRGCSSLEVPRASFQGETERQNPITGTNEKYYPSWKRVVKQLTAVPTAIVAGLLLMCLQALVFAIEIFISEIYDGPLKQYLMFLPTALLATLVPTFTAFYNILATRMTDWENHASNRTYETSMTQKMFVLNFLTAYMGLFLSAYVYLPFGHLLAPNVDFITATAQRVIKFKARGASETITINALRLKQQYIFATATAQFINFFVETLLPYVQRRLFNKTKELVSSGPTLTITDSPAEAEFLTRIRAEEEFPEYDVDDDYREMIVQFGYLSLFSTVWPLAPLFSFINNWVELRGDAAKICLDTKRPIPSKEDTIGPWINNLGFITWLGTLTTASLVSLYRHTPEDAAESGQLVSTRPWILLGSVLLAEHLYFAVRYIVSVVFDAIESTIQLHERQSQYNTRAKELQSEDDSGQVDHVLSKLEHDQSESVEQRKAEWQSAVEEGLRLFELTEMKNLEDKKAE